MPSIPKQNIRVHHPTCGAAMPMPPYLFMARGSMAKCCLNSSDSSCSLVTLGWICIKRLSPRYRSGGTSIACSAELSYSAVLDDDGAVIILLRELLAVPLFLVLNARCRL